MLESGRVRRPRKSSFAAIAKPSALTRTSTSAGLDAVVREVERIPAPLLDDELVRQGVEEGRHAPLRRHGGGDRLGAVVLDGLDRDHRQERQRDPELGQEDGDREADEECRQRRRGAQTEVDVDVEVEHSARPGLGTESEGQVEVGVEPVVDFVLTADVDRRACS